MCSAAIEILMHAYISNDMQELHIKAVVSVGAQN